MIFLVIRDDFHLKSKTYIKIETELSHRFWGTWLGKTRHIGGIRQPIEMVRRQNTFGGIALIGAATFF